MAIQLTGSLEILGISEIFGFKIGSTRLCPKTVRTARNTKIQLPDNAEFRLSGFPVSDYVFWPMREPADNCDSLYIRDPAGHG